MTIKDTMVYIVVCAARSGGSYIVERDLSRCDRKSTLEDIANGEFDRFAQVLECNPVEGTCRDVTEDIAREVVTIWADQNEPLNSFQRDFVENFIGMAAAAAFPREAA